MALQIALDSDQTNVGVAANKAYARVARIQLDTNTDIVSVGVEFHLNQSARNKNKAPIKVTVYTGVQGADIPSIEGNIPGLRKVLYGWLKTLPDFAGAIDT